MGRRIIWTDKMLAELRRLYPDHCIGDIADAVGVSATSVTTKARELGLQRSKEFNRYAFWGRYTHQRRRR